MRHKLKRLAQLSWGDRLLLARLLLLLPILSVALKLAGYKRVYAVLNQGIRHADPVEGMAALAEARSVGQVVKMAANTVRATCLPRSLALWWLLARRGIGSVLRIGVRMDRGVLAAHAWVEVNGYVINDRANVRSLYTPFAADMADQRHLRML